MGETTSEEGGGRPDAAQQSASAENVGPVNARGAPPPSSPGVTADAKFSIDDDDMMEDQPLDEEKEHAPTDADVGVTPADNVTTESSSTSTKPEPSNSDDPTPENCGPTTSESEAEGDDHTTESTKPVEENQPQPSPPTKLGKVKSPSSSAKSSHSAEAASPSTATSPKSTSTPTSRRSHSSPAAAAVGGGEQGENDESDFGPFVGETSLIDETPDDWNPFADDAGAAGEMFHVDDDIQQTTPSNSNSQNNGMQPYERKGSNNSNTGQTPEEELDSLRGVFDSEYERALEDQEISWRARYGATRISFIMSAVFMIVYLWLGCLFYRSEAGWSIPDALLFTVYTVTTVGYGGPQPLPNTAAFHAFTSMYVLVGISLVTVLAAHTYQMVTLEATRIRSSPLRKRQQNQQGDDGAVAVNDFGQEAITREMDKYRQQFMTELEDLVRERPLLDAALVKIKEFQIYMRTTKSGQFLSVALPFLGMIFLGAVVVGSIEKWSPMESIYWSIVTLTTVGYGDYVPTKKSSVWFCTLFFIPSSLFFLSFLLAHVAKSYIRIHAIHVTRLERKMRRRNERQRAEAQRAQRANHNADTSTATDTVSESESKPSNSGHGIDDMENGFTTTEFSYSEGDENGHSPTKSSGLFGDQAVVDDLHNDPLSAESSPALRYRENVIRNKESAPDPKNGNRVVTFAEALKSLKSAQASGELDQFANEDQGQGSCSKPSLDVRLRVQARLARIIAEEVAGHQTGVIIKGSTVSLTVGSLRDTAEKWKMPPQAWKAFRAVAFRSLIFVGERELISDGGDALLNLNVVEFHQIFSPMLAAMGDGGSMVTWLAATDILADIELRGGSRYGQVKTIFNGTFT